MLLVEDWIEASKGERQKHLRLDEPCIERGGDSTQHRGVLAQYLNTSFPKGRTIQLCHACNNGGCSNARHLYWGTAAENTDDALVCGTRKLVKALAGRARSEETKRRISAAMKGRPNNNPLGLNGEGANGFRYKRRYRQIWITDGEESTRIPFGKEIPDGWKHGRTMRVKPIENSGVI